MRITREAVRELRRLLREVKRCQDEMIPIWNADVRRSVEKVLDGVKDS